MFDAWSFDPFTWKPDYPNPAFLLMDDVDAFWAAKQVARFTDEEIRAIVETGEYSDPRATDWITKCLIERRNKIVQAWFSKALPLDRFRVAGGKLAFDDLSAIYEGRPARSYEVRWSSYDNENRRLTALPNAAGTTVPQSDSSNYLAATISCGGASEGACTHPVTVYLRRMEAGHEVVGIDR
jgi:hypothetical protein